jgi:hypothetical protein
MLFCELLLQNGRQLNVPRYQIILTYNTILPLDYVHLLDKTFVILFTIFYR